VFQNYFRFSDMVKICKSWNSFGISV